MKQVLVLDTDYRFLTRLEDNFKSGENVTLHIQNVYLPFPNKKPEETQHFDVVILGNTLDTSIDLTQQILEQYSFDHVIKLFDEIISMETIQSLIHLRVKGFASKEDVLSNMENIVEHICKNTSYIDNVLNSTFIDYLGQISKAKVTFSTGTHRNTKRVKVANLIQKGYSYQDIADELGMSIDSVRYYIKGIYKHLGVKSRAKAMNKLKQPI